MKIQYCVILLIVVLLGSCQKDPGAGFQSKERAIEAVTLGGGLIQVGPADIDRSADIAKVRVLMQEGTDLSSVTLAIQASYHATIEPSLDQPIDFAAHDNSATFTITSASGQTREWTVVLEPFSEPILGTFTIQDLTVYGGTGPEYGGGSVFNLSSKAVWGENGPDKELDNVLTFSYTGVTSDGNTYGDIENLPGPDGQYADFIFSQSPVTDVNHFYRKIPKGKGTWLHNYSDNTLTFSFADGSSTTGSFISAGVSDLGNGLSKTVTDNALRFTLNGTDDWDHIYSDYDKIVQKPRILWIDIKKN